MKKKYSLKDRIKHFEKKKDDKFTKSNADATGYLDAVKRSGYDKYAFEGNPELQKSYDLGFNRGLEAREKAARIKF